MSDDQTEIEGLRAALRALQRENEILRGNDRGRAAGASVVRTYVQREPVDPTTRERFLENAVSELESVVQQVARDECDDWKCTPDDICRPCWATRVLKEIAAWRFGGSYVDPARRFVGSMHERTTNGYHPREAKIHQAWAAYVTDHVLAMILSDKRSPYEWPSGRDWYVATSVVQWLATNCGMGILEAAGFKYQWFDEDRAAYDAANEERRRKALVL